MPVPPANGLADNPKNNRKDKTKRRKAEYVARESSQVPGDEPVDPSKYDRPPEAARYQH